MARLSLVALRNTVNGHDDSEKCFGSIWFLVVNWQQVMEIQQVFGLCLPLFVLFFFKWTAPPLQEMFSMWNHRRFMNKMITHFFIN